MVTRNVTKHLAGVEDLLLGKGVVQQTRAGQAYPIEKLSLVWSCNTVEELEQLDTSKFTQALVAGVPYKYTVHGWVADSVKPVTWVGFAGGADHTGVASSVAAFQAAIDQTAGEKIYTPTYDTVPQAPWVTIHVPMGKYLIDSRVYPNGKHVIWDCDAGVKFLGNIDNMCGKIYLNGSRINATTAASLDGACGFAVSLNRSYGRAAAVMGIGQPSDLGHVTERDAVGLFVENESTIPTLTVASATYTATTVIPSSPVDVRDLLAGMIIDTVPSGYSGVLESWAPDGTSLTVGTGWYQVGGTTTPVIPPASGFVVNQLTKVWAMNAQCVLSAGDTTQRAAGFELGLRNSRTDFTDPSSMEDYQWGFDVAGFGPKPSSIAYIQRGGCLRGFESSGASKDGFVVSKRGTTFPTNAISVLCNSFHQFVSKPNGTDIAYKITNMGDVDMGGIGYAGTKAIRMRSSGLNNDHDTRIQSVGGTATPGQGTLRFGAVATEVLGNFRPVNTNTVSCGTAAQAWANGFTQAAFTVLSDERCKTEMLVITDQLLDAWAEVNWAQYQFLDRIEAKGADGARWHFGLSAQKVIETFKAHGIEDPFKYAFLCYDEWEDQFETEQTNIGAFTLEKQIISEPVRGSIPATNHDGSPMLDADGNQVMLTATVMSNVEVEVQVPDAPVFETKLVMAAGYKYGIRYEEALVLEAALQRRERERDRKTFEALLARIEALESV